MEDATASTHAQWHTGKEGAACVGEKAVHGKVGSQAECHAHCCPCPCPWGVQVPVHHHQKCLSMSCHGMEVREKEGKQKGVGEVVEGGGEKRRVGRGEGKGNRGR